MRSRLIGLLLTSVLLLAGCVVASPDTDTYRDAAASTLSTAVSEVATVRTMLDLLDRDNISRPAVVTQLRYSEDGLSRAAQGFASINPPPELDDIADQAALLLDDAGSALREVRLAVHRHESTTYPVLVHELKRLTDELQTLESRFS